MFGKKAKLIKNLGERVDELFAQRTEWRDRAVKAERELAARLDAIGNLEAQLQFSEEETQKLHEENRDLEIRLELLQSVLKQLNIPVKLKK